MVFTCNGFPYLIRFFVSACVMSLAATDCPSVSEGGSRSFLYNINSLQCLLIEILFLGKKNKESANKKKAFDSLSQLKSGSPSFH